MSHDPSHDSGASYAQYEPAIDTDAAYGFLYRNGSAIEMARLAHWRGDSDDEAFWRALGAYQNPDGGWAHGIDPDYQGAASSVQSTIEALRIITAHQQADHANVGRTVQFLRQHQQRDGSWQEFDDVLQQNAPSWYAPARFRVWETGCLAGYCLALGFPDLWSGAARYVRETWQQMPTPEYPQPLWAALLVLGHSNNERDRAIVEQAMDELGRLGRRERIDAYDVSWLVEVLTMLEPPGTDELLHTLGDMLAVRQESDGGMRTSYGDVLRPRATFNALMAVALIGHRMAAS
jgi:hypothetical protein